MHQERTTLAIGPSSMSWDGSALTARIDEITAPFPSRIRGIVRLIPTVLLDREFPLHAYGQHRWSPLAPCARVEVELERPALRWSGRAYLDSNAGDAPLADAFQRWHWSRTALRRGATAVLYDVVPRADAPLSLALRFDPDGTVQPFAPPPSVSLPRTFWRVERVTRADPGTPAEVLRTFEDTPFYARSLVKARLLGEPATAVHESLSLDRFRARWVQLLLPFRSPRRGRRGAVPEDRSSSVNFD